jgi:hypothetical protein
MAKASKFAQYGGELQFEQWFMLKLTEDGFGVILERVSNRRLDTIEAVKQLWFHYQPVGPKVIQPLADYLRTIAYSTGFEAAQSFLSYLTRQVASYFMGVTPYEPVPDPDWSVKIEEIIDDLIEIEQQEQQFVPRLPYGALESMILNNKIIVDGDSKPESLNHELKIESINYHFETNRSEEPTVKVDVPEQIVAPIPIPKIGIDPTPKNKGVEIFEQICSKELESEKWGPEIREEHKELFLEIVNEQYDDNKMGYQNFDTLLCLSKSLLGRLIEQKPPDLTKTNNWLFVRTSAALWGLDEEVPEKFKEHTFSKIKEKYKPDKKESLVDAALKEGAVNIGFRKKKVKIRTPEAGVRFFEIQLDPKFRCPLFSAPGKGMTQGRLPYYQHPKERLKPQRRTVAEWKMRKRNAASDARTASYSQSGQTKSQIRASRTSRALKKTAIERFYYDSGSGQDHDFQDHYSPGSTPSLNNGEG